MPTRVLSRLCLAHAWVPRLSRRVHAGLRLPGAHAAPKENDTAIADICPWVVSLAATTPDATRESFPDNRVDGRGRTVMKGVPR